MRLKFTLPSLFILVTLLLGIFFTKVAFADTFTLSGSVKDASGNPIVNASVSVNDPGSGTTTTDNSGNYTLSISNGTYNVQVTPESGSGFSSAVALNQNVTSNTELNFILVPSGSVRISGHLYDNLGNPLSNQQVVLNLASGGQVASVITDSSGSYSFQNSSNSYQLTVNGNNNNGALNVPETYSFNLPNRSYTQSTIQDITVPAKKVDIHVQDGSGTAVNNVVVKTTGGNVGQQNIQIGGGVTVFGLNGYLTNGKTTNASGNTTLWLFSGTNAYTIVANPPSESGYSQTVSNNNVISGDTTLTITLQQSVTISGTLWDGLGNALPNQRVTLNLSSGGEVGSVNTNASGNYSFQTSPGSYQLSISGNNNNGSLNVPETYSFNLPNASYTQNTVRDITVPAKKVDIHMQDAAGNAISGVVLKTSGGNVGQQNIPIGGGITVFGLNGYLTNGKTTNASGNATLWLFPGTTNTYTIVANPPSESNYNQGIFSNNSITADTNLTFTLQQPITISGHIYDVLGNPLPNQQITLNLVSTGGQVGSVTTNSSGSYSFQTTTNSYNLAVTGNNSNGTLNVPESYSFTLPNTTYTQNTFRDITVTAKKLTIHVQDAFENPVGGVVLKTSGGNVGQQNLPIGGGTTVFGLNGYLTNGKTTDDSGNTVMWLFPGTTNTYTITANPPSGSIYSNFILNNVSVTADQNILVSLQYSHAAPTTNANLVTQYVDGTYTDPTTVTLSASAASGYTVANTYYTIDGETQQTYSSPFTVTGNGNHTITYWSVDSSGVQELHQTKTFTIHQNQAPVVDPFSGGTINRGQTFTASSFFTDADSTSWTATVDYGDIGGGEEPLTLHPDKTFTLNHQYNTAGEYTVVVVVRDNQQSTGSTQATVTVVVPDPATTTFNSSADTYLRSGTPNRNLGGGGFMRLQASGDNRSLVRFDQSTMQTEIGNKEILSAKLRVTITDGGTGWGQTGRTIDVHRLLTNWTEGNGTENDQGTGSGVTWSCATDSNIDNSSKNCSGSTEWEMGQPNNPSVHPWAQPASATQTITNNQTGVVEFDVTSDVASFLNSTNQNYGWLIKKTNEGLSGNVSFGTKESTSAPQLVVTYQP